MAKCDTCGNDYDKVSGDDGQSDDIFDLFGSASVTSLLQLATRAGIPRAVGTSLSNLAGMYMDQGRYAEADPLLKRALAIDEKAAWAPSTPNIGQSHNNLAAVYLLPGPLWRGRAVTQASPRHRRKGARPRPLAPADVFISADLDWMDYLSGKGLIKNDSEQLWPRSSDAT